MSYHKSHGFFISKIEKDPPIIVLCSQKVSQQYIFLTGLGSNGSNLAISGEYLYWTHNTMGNFSLWQLNKSADSSPNQILTGIQKLNKLIAVNAPGMIV